MIEAETRVTRVHREPSANGYGSVTDVPPTEPLVPHLVPELAIRLNDLEL